LLFNSYEFIFGFLPIVLVVTRLLAAYRPPLAPAWLALASLVFYGWWSPEYIWLLTASMAGNFWVGGQLARRASASQRTSGLLIFGIIVNLGLLGYFKYAGFLTQAVAAVTGVDLSLAEIALPVGISFFTFTQIAYLVDAHRGLAREYDAASYALFVTYFPHLIAGPILHHKEMIPQFREEGACRFSLMDLSAGGALFVIGLGKKVLLADPIAPIADNIFRYSTDVPLTMAEAWVGALAYTLQIYFDFSGYSDMALGLSRMMGIRLPLNFDSPYKARNIIDFWRRWHMTLSRFLRDYLYVALGGNRKGRIRRYTNLMITMLLGGLWHGAGWTFVVWGGLHGLYLVINHAWRALRPGEPGKIEAVIGWGLTFLAVVVAWVFFRAQDMDQATAMLRAMSGANGLAIPATLSAFLPTGLPIASGGNFVNGLIQPIEAVTRITVLLAVAIALPNSQQLLASYRPAYETVSVISTRLIWRPTAMWGITIGSILATALSLLSGASPFLYFRF
jgi:D-alanyl-lipoteichoic acid acyltransferase DltB (MBOAT superfamily)